MKRVITTMTAGILLFLGSSAMAQSGEELLNFLKNKGIINQQEADSIRRSEIKRDSFPLRLGRTLDLSGYTQVNYLNFQQSGKINGFQIKRARLDFQGHFSSRFDYRLLVDFVGNSGAGGSAQTGGALVSPLLLDAYITYKPFTWLNIKAGQMLVQFSLENLTQDRNLDMVERSQVVNALVARKGDSGNGLIDSIGNQNGRDLGIQINGSLFPIGDYHFLDYYLQVLDGAGIDVTDNNQAKDVDGRLVFHPYKDLSIGANYYNGFDRFTGTPTKDQERIRWGADASWTLQSLSLKGEWIRGQEGNKDPILHQGWYGQAGYFVLHHSLQAVVRYDRYNPNVDKSVLSTYYDLGLNYFFNVWTKLQVYYSCRGEQNAHVANNMFEAQLQLGF
jgi:phosphate-selective porin OprO/OprP